MVTVHTKTAEEAEEAADVMDDCGAIDIDEHTDEETKGPYGSESRSSTTDQDFDRNTAPRNDLQRGPEPVFREDRSAESQRSRIVGRPVDEEARMRQRDAIDEQNPVDQAAAASAPALELFKEGEIELTEHKEVPLVKKEARVVEEIKVKKIIEDREETVHDSVRKTDVEIEKLEAPEQDSYTGLTESRTESTRGTNLGGDKKSQEEIEREKEDWERRSSGDPLFDA